MEKVLVILASFNGEKYVKEQVETILAQVGVDVSIYIFDDGSKDQTLSILSSEYSYDTRIRIFVNENPTGSAANNFLNALQSFDDFFLDRYDYIAFADQDDIWLPNKLQAATNMLQLQKSDLYMSNLMLWEEKNNRKTLINKSYTQKKYDYLFEGGSAGCTYVFTSSFAKELNKTICNINFSNWKFFSHDWFVYFFSRLNQYKVVIDKESFIFYRVHSTNVHGHLNTFSFFAIKERLKLVKNGWYFRHAEGYMTILSPYSDEYKIYSLYTRNYFTRMYVIFRYNFSLIRDPKKALKFFIISLLPL